MAGRTREIRIRHSNLNCPVENVKTILKDEQTGKTMEGITWVMGRNNEWVRVAARDERHR